MKLHKCNMRITEVSNAIQFDAFGYPLRLCVLKCSKCGRSKQAWIDTSKEINDFEVLWKDVHYGD